MSGRLERTWHRSARRMIKTSAHMLEGILVGEPVRWIPRTSATWKLVGVSGIRAFWVAKGGQIDQSGRWVVVEPPPDYLGAQFGERLDTVVPDRRRWITTAARAAATSAKSEIQSRRRLLSATGEGSEIRFAIWPVVGRSWVDEFGYGYVWLRWQVAGVALPAGLIVEDVISP